MPQTQTAQMLVDRARRLLNYYDNTPFCDGFPDDPSGLGNCTPILPFINDGLTQLLGTGFVRCQYTFLLAYGVPQYTLTQDIAEIDDCLIAGKALERRTILQLDRDYPGWQNYTSNLIAPPVQPARPKWYYTTGDQIGLVPQPDQAYEVTIRAEGVIPDLVNPTDVPEKLPIRFQYKLSYYAALKLANIDLENDAMKARIPDLANEWATCVKDLTTVVNSRGWDADDQIQPRDYRESFRRGSDG